ncbi:hypothetical protein DHEL01_v207720 [Diaporthe helianthi]|uniref:ubiquitinyl hydrolase 1 n=1 Tax=Diaporthe helianthi TaxID=158607 RepID=A0A2P5HUG8_DIAHE|nr:hypothetical protein DHEL01_v207720 [Diaporthe helianthi]
MTLEGVFNHLVLPPKLPGGEDPHLVEEGRDFVTRLIAAIDTLNAATNENYSQSLAPLLKSLDLCRHLNQSCLDKDTLAAALKDFGHAPLVLHVVEQNAALIIRPSGPDEPPKSVVFEAFEASPTSEAVLASENALIQTFPGRACAIPESCFNSDDFQSSLAEFLDKASNETLNRLVAHTRKAGDEIIEVRDTTNPAMITQLLLPLFESFGEPIQVDQFQKRVRDDVNIQVQTGTGSPLPFRRHPFWLVLRVAVQRQLVLSLGYHRGRAMYKAVIAIVLAQLMTNVVGCLKPQLTLMLRTKLCRRLAKLEQERAQEPGDSTVYDSFFRSMGPWLEENIQLVNNRMNSVWDHFKRRTTRQVELLPAPRFVPLDHFRLQLRLSGSYLEGLLRLPQQQRPHKAAFDPAHINDEVIQHVQKFNACYFNIVAFEAEIRARPFDRLNACSETTHTSSEPQFGAVSGQAGHNDGIEHPRSRGFDPPAQRAPPVHIDHANIRCIELAESISKYFESVGNAYDSNPTQMSGFVLNVFHLWVLMDLAAIETCPLIREYHPMFTPELLDVLQLVHVDDFDRLHTVQRHLRDRVKSSRAHSHDILSADNSPSSFAAKYLVQNHELQVLYLEILEDSQQARQEKEVEWHTISEECEELSQEMAALSCVCTGEPGERTHDDIKDCTKCFLRRNRRRMTIEAHEDFLPIEDAKAAKILFELSVPRWYEAYRNITFKIIHDLAWPARIDPEDPPLILKDFGPLKPYQRSRPAVKGVTLASPKKSFLQTHWKVIPVLHGSLGDVLHSHGPEFDLYDIDNKVWMSAINRRTLTFQHHCGILLPGCLRESVLLPHPHPPAVEDGPSSYAVIANERQCPQQVSIHEFSAHQRLLSGVSRRWLTMLVELGSSHLNFSSSETVRFLSHLALQAGPCDATGSSGLREAYQVFGDDDFCFRLGEMIDQRLESIKSNWREVNLMELCIALSQRLRAFTSSDEACKLAERSIQSARDATLGWIGRLRGELRNAKDGEAADRAAAYAFKSAILCRRTFATSNQLTAEELQAYCEASIALQEHMATGFESDPVLKAMVIQDTKMEIGATIYAAMRKHPMSLELAISKAWSESGNSTDTTFSSWTRAEGTQPWVVARMTSTFPKANGQSYAARQTVHFNYVSGFLLVDGKPAGRLPERIRDSDEVKTLFGAQMHLRTHSSGLSGMSHQLIAPVEGQQIHFGLRNDQVVIRAVSRTAILEFIPGKVFFRNANYDLPVELLENCVHFLNLSTESVQIHRRPRIWTLRKTDWVISLRTHQCTQNNGRSGRLICPYSDTAQIFERLFHHFERPELLRIFLSKNRQLCVNLSRFELSFKVNQNRRLEERKLGKEIDPNQDAGTFHGLNSKLVLRDTRDVRRRTIIVPLGRTVCSLSDTHVEVTVVSESQNAYAKYEIDDVLGRLTCPPEPTLLYTKALLHALTSFPIPDKLTGRTGTEEAIHILRCGMSQPWTPLTPYPASRLEAIAALPPRRDFYPEDRRSLQRTQWSPNLPDSIQHERLETLARHLLQKSNRLQPFCKSIPDVDEVDLASHLRRRAEIRRSVYDPSSIHPPGLEASTKHNSNGKASTGASRRPQIAPARVLDKTYASRDQSLDTALAKNVKHVVKSSIRRPFHLSQGLNLRSLLIGQRIIGGFQTSAPCTEGITRLVEDTVAEQFGELVEFSRQCSFNQLYSLAFRLALMSFKPHANLELLEVLAAIARLDSLKVLVPPQHAVFVDFDLIGPTVEDLEAIIRSEWPSFIEPRGRRTSKRDAHDQHLLTCEEEGRRLARWFVKQWPSEAPSLDGFQSGTKLLNSADALDSVLEFWQQKTSNMHLGTYIDELQLAMDKFCSEGRVMLPEPDSTTFLSPSSCKIFSRVSSVIPSLSLELLTKAADACTLPLPWNSASLQLAQVHGTSKPRKASPGPEFNELQRVLTPFLNSSDQERKRYGQDLLRSLQALRNRQSPSLDHDRGWQHRYESAAQMDHLIHRCRMNILEIYDSIQKALGMGDKRSIWLPMANLWPGGKVTVLEQLRSTEKTCFGAGMKEMLVRFGVTNTELQWLERLRHYQLTQDNAKFEESLRNTGHQNWDPLQRPDWLLVELECDLLIRPEQVQVANAIISPSSGENSVLQMNMGQGKTSCIVPMAIAILADTAQIARLVVPKALLLQSAQLSGLQRLVDSKIAEADVMIRFQETLTRFCRDVIDESDFTLAVKTQLIYPSGPQLSVDGAPQRWTIVQELLRLFEEHLPAIRKAFPHSVEVIPRTKVQAFPMAFLLRRDAEDEFHRLVIEDIVNNRTTFLRLSESGLPPKEVRRTIRQFLSEASTKLQDKVGLKEVVSLFADQESAAKTLLLARGLILNRILLFCMKRRFNVQYGLHPNRDPIAVPFEAKGVPSETSEFGHPDVAIIFTTLSFYYAGLTVTQFRQSLSSILKADDAASAYDRWIHGCDALPAGLRHWNVINCDDEGQINELYSHLRLDRNVLNTYLNSWVFPSYAKQFGLKLSASAWDLPNFARPQKPALPGARSTGFSGTNDNKSLLPLNIRQHDLPALVQTNAEVLSHLLQPRNRHYHCAAHHGVRLSEEELLQTISKRKMMVLIDAGAYILELSNQDLVSKWLDVNNEAKAGVFFGDDNRAWVLYRGVKRKKVPLVATPFADDLTECVVFLDEAHCRGTDLKLPHNAMGALTLALGQTKDQTVQAAMRLRQLATSQSVTFFAGPEVHQSILDACKLPGRVVIHSGHIVHWLLEQSCCANEHLANLHIAQGVDYCRRLNAQWKYDQFLTQEEHRTMLLSVIRQQERQTLNEQYSRVTDATTKGSPDEVVFPALKGFMSTLASERKAMAANPGAGGMHSSALEEVEQEREVEFQVEEVRQVQKRKIFKPLGFPGLHAAFKHFVHKGELLGDDGYMHAFTFLGSTSIGHKFMVRMTSSRFFVSKEFTRTVVLSKQGQNKHPDNFLRPVEYILWSPVTDTALVIIPEEAELLIPIMRRAGPRCLVHLITYSAPVTKATLRNFNGLTFYNMPALPNDYKFPKWLIIELGILAGRLYVDHDECAAVAQYLQLSQREDDQLDGPAEQEETFAENPVTFMSEWLAHRRQSDILHTPMGYILRGRIDALHPEHAFFRTHTNEAQGSLDAPLFSGKRHDMDGDHDQEEDDDSDSDLDHDGDEIGEGWDHLGEELGLGFGEDVGDVSIEDGPERVAAEKALFDVD